MGSQAPFSPLDAMDLIFTLKSTLTKCYCWGLFGTLLWGSHCDLSLCLTGVKKRPAGHAEQERNSW